MDKAIKNKLRQMVRDYFEGVSAVGRLADAIASMPLEQRHTLRFRLGKCEQWSEHNLLGAPCAEWLQARKVMLPILGRHDALKTVRSPEALIEIVDSVMGGIGGHQHESNSNIAQVAYKCGCKPDTLRKQIAKFRRHIDELEEAALHTVEGMVMGADRLTDVARKSTV
jgi:hypothetical protein